jgi:hypothetical protein
VCVWCVTWGRTVAMVCVVCNMGQDSGYGVCVCVCVCVCSSVNMPMLGWQLM